MTKYYYDEALLWAFGAEWQGNVKPGIDGLTVGELLELTEQYPEIWGEYVRAYPETEGQIIDTGVPAELGSDVPADQAIEPDTGWFIAGQIGTDTFEEGL